MNRLHELSMQLAGPLDLGAALKAILQAAVEIHGATGGLLSLHDDALGVPSVKASIGFDSATLALIERVQRGPNAESHVTSFGIKTRVVTYDTETDSRFEDHRDINRSAGFRAVHSTPILPDRAASLEFYRFISLPVGGPHRWSPNS